ncbi:MAG: hypothetical protein LQ339_004979 [Xanthoria mediterranea]|nr:MAG: hypothetical protein LQ339_004979 [Xanthoria mediterranea]
MAGFLSLPREIRDMIYDYCLVVNGEIVPHPAEYEYPRYKPAHVTEQPRNYMDRKPDVALLQVNKEIREETCPILYGRNLWRMSGTLSHWDRRVRTFARFDRLLRYFKHVISSFDSRDLDHGYFDVRSQLRYHKFVSHEFELTEERMVPLHELRNGDLRECWYMKMDFPFGADLHLETVTIDIHNSWCAFGCCRSFGFYDIHSRFYWTMETRLMIRGIIDQEEARSLQHEYQNESKEAYEFQSPRPKHMLEIMIEEENGSYTLMDDKKDLSARAREIQENYIHEFEALN